MEGHGQSRGCKITQELRAFYSARRRCTDPSQENYKFYGGRGIQFKFQSFAQFFAELGPRPKGMSLDRKQNWGHYEPGNVKWSTMKEQCRNRRSFHDFTGETIGRLTVLRSERVYKGRVTWKCFCSCGKETEKTTEYFRTATIASCGCHAKEVSLQNLILIKQKGPGRSNQSEALES